MKKSILIGLVLAITSSSAYAYVISSQKQTKTFGGAPNTTYYIKCNSGISKIIVSNPVSWTNTVYEIQVGGPTTQFATMDQAAKAACNE
jgi:hypothetical protein